MGIADLSERRCLVIFTKPARPGRVKTRLIGDLSPEQAAALHAAFLEDLVDRLRAGPFKLELAWELDSDQAVPSGSISGFRQSAGELGDKLLAGLGRAARGARFVAAVGSDHPDLPMARVTAAFEALERGADLVIGPAVDGGYYLIAATKDTLAPELFEGIQWSTSKVLATTLERAHGLGLRTVLLDEGEDVDTPSDLQRLADRISTGPTCPRTQELLTAWDLLPTPGTGRTT